MKKSDTTGKLAAALSLLQGEVSDIEKDGKAHKHKYVTYSAVKKVSRPLLCKNGLSIAHFGGNADDLESVKLETVLMHSSGEWQSGVFGVKLPGLKDNESINVRVQLIGAIITYLKRYAECCILGITQVDEDEIEMTPYHSAVPNQSRPAYQAARPATLSPQAQKVRKETLEKLQGLLSQENAQKVTTWMKEKGLADINQLEEVVAQKWIEGLKVKKE